MAKHFSGDEKLRIVLESIIRGISKGEQCRKYECSESDFDSWREHLVTNGGKVFEPGYNIVATKSKKSSGGGLLAKLVLTLSVLANLGVLSALVAWKMKWIDVGSFLTTQEVASTSLKSPSPVSPLSSSKMPVTRPKEGATLD